MILGDVLHHGLFAAGVHLVAGTGGAGATVDLSVRLAGCLTAAARARQGAADLEDLTMTDVGEAGVGAKSEVGALLGGDGVIWPPRFPRPRRIGNVCRLLVDILDTRLRAAEPASNPDTHIESSGGDSSSGSLERGEKEEEEKLVAPLRVKA